MSPAPRSARSARLAGGAALWALASLLGACDDGRSAASSAMDRDDQAVLLVGTQPIAAEEVDAVAEWFRSIHPKATQDHLRRIALDRVVVPRAALAQTASEQRSRALEACREALEALRDGGLPPTGEELRLIVGNSLLSPEVAGLSRGLEAGIWSEPLEGVGRFLLIRIEAEHTDAVPSRTVVEFPYLAATADLGLVQERVAAVSLTLVDPAWRAAIPSALESQLKSQPR